MFRIAQMTGRTVAELKLGSGAHRPISAREVMEWSAYETVFGPLDTARRVEIACAIIAATVASSIPREKGAKKLEVSDFMQDWDPAPPYVASPEEMMDTLRNVFG